VIELLQHVRSLVALLGVGLWFAACSPVLRLSVLPQAWLWPRRRLALVSAFMKLVVRGIHRCMRLGGARIVLVGTIPTEPRITIVANHQSLLDIPNITAQCLPTVTAFVTRSRYARFVPLVSACVRMLDCPIVDPRRDPRRAVETIAREAARLDHALLIFPEGHRSRTGEILPWRKAGLRAILAVRRDPVYLAVGDGLWISRRLVDFVFNIHRIRCRAEVIGPFVVPDREEEHEAFIDGLRQRMIDHLASMRLADRG
jgi:1-acyl-sn-glycerol-3-phosphate acyltransferase